jgi:hypothetical protein
MMILADKKKLQQQQGLPPLHQHQSELTAKLYPDLPHSPLKAATQICLFEGTH